MSPLSGREISALRISHATRPFVFVTLHPFDDGNGCIARAISDLLLAARADGSPQRFYSLSAQIQRERKAYYDILEHTQKESLDVTGWLAWLLDTLHRAVDQAQPTLNAVLTKARFWQRWATTPLNERQVGLLNRLLDGFEGKLTTSKWATIAKCSPDTALPAGVLTMVAMTEILSTNSVLHRICTFAPEDCQ